jgi:hypothetical protein
MSHLASAVVSHVAIGRFIAVHQADVVHMALHIQIATATLTATIILVIVVREVVPTGVALNPHTCWVGHCPERDTTHRPRLLIPSLRTGEGTFAILDGREVSPQGRPRPVVVFRLGVLRLVGRRVRLVMI